MSQYSKESEQIGTTGSYGPGTGNLPQTRPHRRRRRRFAIIAALIGILLIVLLLLFFFPRPTATVTLTPASKTLSAPVTGSYAPRGLSSVQQGSGSGNVIKPGTQANGTLTFKNYTPYWVTIPGGTVVVNVTGQQVVTEKTIQVPPDPIIPGIASVSARAVKVGKNGNIAVLSINKLYAPDVYVLNTLAFSGGQDDQPGNTVQQSDIDRVAKLQVALLMPQALTALQKQLNEGEQLVKPNPTCDSPVVTSNPAVGANAAQFTVSVSLTCTDAAYNPQTIPSQEEDVLKQQAIQLLNPGPTYIPVGAIALKVGQETPQTDGNIHVLATANGTWNYQFSAAQKLDMAKHIARETTSDAKAWLSQQTGVAAVSISVSGPIIDLSGHNVVPDDLNAITING
jgi:P pilus assembly chaperone PapD